MTIFYDIHHFSRTLGDVWKHHHKNTTKTQPEHHLKNTTTKTPQKHHHTPQKHHQNTTTTPPPPPPPPPPVFNVRDTHSDERVARRCPKCPFYHSFEHPTPTKWREGCHAHTQNFDFTTVLSFRHVRSDERVARPDPEFAFYLSVRHVRSDEKVARAGARIRILPQFWKSDTSEVMKGSLGHVKNLRFTTVLKIRHVRSDERVARPRKKFAFYHSFECPTRTKWRKGRSASSKIYVLPQFWASDTHEVTRGLSNPQVRSLRPDRKRIYFKTFLTLLQKILISSISLQSFL